MSSFIELSLIVLAYLLGSIPFGLIVMRLAGEGDVRNIGSGNIGATNVLRAGRKELAALTLFLDAAKGFTAIVIANGVNGTSHFIFLIGLAVVLGHIFPVWLKFKGGKGVATAIGVIFGMSFGLGLAIIAVWLVVFIITRISSLAALLSFAINCMTAGLAGKHGDFMFMVLLTLILCYTHRQNIRRLMQGTEPAFRKDNP